MNKDDEIRLTSFANNYPNMKWASQDPNGHWWLYEDKPTWDKMISSSIANETDVFMWNQYDGNGFQFVFEGNQPIDASKEIYKIERKVTFLQLGENKENGDDNG